MSFKHDLSLHMSFLNCIFSPYCFYMKSEPRASREKTLGQYCIFYFVTPTAVEIHPQICSWPPLHSTSKLGATAHLWPESQVAETSIISWHWQHSSDSDPPRAQRKKQTNKQTEKKPTHTNVVILPQEEMCASIASASSWLRNTSESILRIDNCCFLPPSCNSSGLNEHIRRQKTSPDAHHGKMRQIFASFDFASQQLCVPPKSIRPC